MDSFPHNGSGVLEGGRGGDLLEGEGLLGDGTAEQVSQVVGSSVHLILGGGDVEVLDEVLKDSDRLSRLLAGDSRDRRNINSRHFDRKSAERRNR